MHDVNILDEIVPEAGAFYVIDRGYLDFARLFVFTLCSSFFVTRTKENVLLLVHEPADFLAFLEKLASLGIAGPLHPVNVKGDGFTGDVLAFDRDPVGNRRVFPRCTQGEWRSCS